MADLGNKVISSNYQKLLQISESGAVSDGTGSAFALRLSGSGLGINHDPVSGVDLFVQGTISASIISASTGVFGANSLHVGGVHISSQNDTLTFTSGSSELGAFQGNGYFILSSSLASGGESRPLFSLSQQVGSTQNVNIMQIKPSYFKFYLNGGTNAWSLGAHQSGSAYQGDFFLNDNFTQNPFPGGTLQAPAFYVTASNKYWGIGTFPNSTNMMRITGSLFVEGPVGHITASGDISASGGIFGTAAIKGGTINNVSIGSTTPATYLKADNIELNGNVIKSDASMILQPLGTFSTLTIKKSTIVEGSISASGNITASGNVKVAGNVEANGNIVGDGSTNISGINHITASGNISASGTIYASAFSSPHGDGDIDFSDSLDIAGNITASGNISASGELNATELHLVKTGAGANEKLLTITEDGTEKFYVDEDGDIYAGGNITASLTEGGGGNISASGTITANQYDVDGNQAITYNSGYRFGFTNTIPIQIGKSANPISLIGNVTSSGDISASGDLFVNNISASGFISTDTDITASGTITSLDEFILKHQEFEIVGDTLVRIYGFEGDDGVIDVYRNNSVVNRIHGRGLSYFNGGGVNIGGGILSASIGISASRLTTFDDITLKDGGQNGDTLVKIYDADDDGVISVYRNNIEQIKLNGANGSISASGFISTKTNITASGTITSLDEIILKDGSLTEDTLVKQYASGDDGVIDIYKNNSVQTRLNGNGTSFFGGDGQVGNNLGIGTTTPTQTLTVAGAISASNHITTDSYISASGAIISQEEIILDHNGNDTLVKLYNSDDDGIIDVYQNNSVKARIHGNGTSYFRGGDVEIGSDGDIGKKLSIWGSISASNNGGTGGHITASGKIVTTDQFILHDGNLLGDNLVKLHSSSDDGIVSVYRNNSEVIELTGAGGGKITVGGNISGSSTSTITAPTFKVKEGSANGIYNFNGKLKISSSNDIIIDGGDDIFFQSQGTEIVHIRGDEAILEVEGDIDLDGTLDVSSHITASGNISASGTITSSTGSFGRVNATTFTGDGAGLENVPDYVFEPQYILRTLTEVEQHIGEHKHLPGIPSVDDKDGWSQLSVGDRDMKLLEKVEELTLYVIDLQKQINELKT